ncbi:hypothetical protein ALC56_01995, partial [Trachymyrmex septentrionalis]
REKEGKRGASSCRSVLRFDVGNHAPHSLSAAEIFGFIVCEGLKVGKREAARRRARKTSRKGEGGSTSRMKKEEEEGEEEDRGRTDGGKRQRETKSIPVFHRSIRANAYQPSAPHSTEKRTRRRKADAQASSPTCWIFFSIIKDWLLRLSLILILLRSFCRSSPFEEILHPS